jgi:hypothetical protein
MKEMIFHILKENSVEKTINGSVTGCILENNYGTVINETSAFVKPLIFEFAKYVVKESLYFDKDINEWYYPNIKGSVKQDVVFAKFELERSRRTQKE